jgi:predicted PurR-regulated permease PerM
VWAMLILNKKSTFLNWWWRLIIWALFVVLWVVLPIIMPFLAGAKKTFAYFKSIITNPNTWKDILLCTVVGLVCGLFPSICHFFWSRCLLKNNHKQAKIWFIAFWVLVGIMVFIILFLIFFFPCVAWGTNGYNNRKTSEQAQYLIIKIKNFNNLNKEEKAKLYFTLNGMILNYLRNGDSEIKDKINLISQIKNYLENSEHKAAVLALLELIKKEFQWAAFKN